MSLGYDTIRIRRVQYDLPQAPWSYHGRDEFGDTNRVKASAVHQGVTFKFDRIEKAMGPGLNDVTSSAISAEVSLPKLLWGHNVGDLSLRSDVADALGKLSTATCSFLGRDEDVSEWMLSRVDVTADRALSDESACLTALRRLSAIPIRGRFPVRGQAGTVSWPSKRGGFTRKAYSKFAETGLEVARGRLRVEVGAIGLRAIRAAFPGGKSRPGVYCVDLLSEDAEQMKTIVAGKMIELVDQVIREKDMQAFEAFDVMVKNRVKIDTAARLLGYALMMRRLGGGRGYKWLEEVTTRTTAYNTRKAFEELGIDALSLEFTEEDKVKIDFKAASIHDPQFVQEGDGDRFDDEYEDEESKDEVA